MDKDFLLYNPTAKQLYHEHAAKMPILDYHCHVSPREIFEDKHFENITQVWELTKAKLAQPDMGVRGLIKMSNVAFVGTTDDPVYMATLGVMVEDICHNNAKRYFNL